MLHFVKRGRPSRSTGKAKDQLGHGPDETQENHHAHPLYTVEGNQTKFHQTQARSRHTDVKRTMSMNEAVFALVPTLARMKERGFGAQKIVERLHVKGIDVPLTKYLTEVRGQREGLKAKKQASLPPKCEQRSSFITPDIPDDEL